MAQQLIADFISGDQAKDIINGNFTELYQNLPQVTKLPGMNANTQQAVAADTMVTFIAVSGVAGTPLLRIGITPNGQEILPDTEIGSSQPINAMQYFGGAGNLYFTLSGGTINARIEYKPNYYG